MRPICPSCGEIATAIYNEPLCKEWADKFKERIKHLQNKTTYLYLNYLHPDSLKNIELAQNLIFLAQAKLNLGYSFGWYGSNYLKSKDLEEDFVEIIDNIEDYKKLSYLDITLNKSARFALDKLLPICKRESLLEDVRNIVQQVLARTDGSTNSNEVECAVDDLIAKAISNSAISNRKREADLEQIYRIDYIGHGEHGTTNVWYIVGKLAVPSSHELNVPFKNDGNYGAIYVKASDNRLGEVFVTAFDLIENFSFRYEDSTTKKIFKVWHSHKNEYWISTFPKNRVLVEDLYHVYEVSHSGYAVFLEAHSSYDAFLKGKQLLDKYPIEDVIPSVEHLILDEKIYTNKEEKVVASDNKESVLSEKRCELCQHYCYYFNELFQVERSECRCNPPTTFVYDKTRRDINGNLEGYRAVEAYWPKVFKLDWCGKFVEKENIPK